MGDPKTWEWLLTYHLMKDFMGPRYKFDSLHGTYYTDWKLRRQAALSSEVKKEEEKPKVIRRMGRMDTLLRF